MYGIIYIIPIDNIIINRTYTHNYTFFFFKLVVKLFNAVNKHQKILAKELGDTTLMNPNRGKKY